MRDVPVDPRHRWQQVLDAVDPPENPRAQIYGTLTAGTLLAAESGRHESYLQLAGSVALALVLVWLAHSYATAVGHRIETNLHHATWPFLRSLIHELSLLRGAFVPLAAVLLAGAADASVAQAATAGLVCAAALLVVFEVLAGVRSHLRRGELAAQLVLSVLLGLGVLALKVIVH